MGTWYQRLVAGALLGVVAGASLLVSAALVNGAEPGNERLYIMVDRSKILDLSEPVTKISITNPGIADVNVLSPTSILLSGKSPGATSLLLFSSKRVQHFDLVVQPAPVDRAAPVTAGEPHDILVQRADRITNQIFLRDETEGWVELGSVKPATEAKR